MSLTVTIPGKKTSSRARGPQYIAPNSGSMTMTLLTVNGAAVSASAQGPYNLTPGPTNPNCVVATNTTCTFQISAPIGTDIFLANTYTTSNGTGQPLGSGSVLLSVRQNTSNAASLSLTGPVASVQVVTSTGTLWNGNPIPAPVCSDCAIARGAGAQAVAVRQGRAAAASAASAGRSQASASTRRSPAQVQSTPAPTPAGASTAPARVFVIALDAAGNEIINPTTFDIPITLTLALNGTPAGGVTLAVTYAGLTGEPTSASSTSSDGGTVAVYAPSDTVTLTLNGTSALNQTFAPTVTASYTPQGGSPQTSTPLAFTVYIPVPAAQLEASASHVDPLTVGIAANLTDAVLNTGNAPTSGQIQAYFYPSSLNYNGYAGSDPSWTCNYYGYVYCTSNAVIPANGSLGLVFQVTPTGGTAYNELDVFGGNAVNANDDVYVVDTINVLAAAAILNVAQTTTALTDGNFAQGTAGAINITVSNVGTLPTTSTVTLVDTLPAGMNGTGAGTGWSCGAQSGQTITCTLPGIAASSAAAPVVFTVTPTTAGNLFNGLSATSTGAITGSNSVLVTVYGPLTLTPQAPSAPDHLQLFMGTNGLLGAQESYYNGTLTASLVNGLFGSPPCSSYISLLNPSLSGPQAYFSANPLQVTNVIYNAGNPATYCTISVADTNGRSATIPVTVTSVTLNGQ